MRRWLLPFLFSILFPSIHSRTISYSEYVIEFPMGEEVTKTLVLVPSRPEGYNTDLKPPKRMIVELMGVGASPSLLYPVFRDLILDYDTAIPAEETILVFPYPQQHWVLPQMWNPGAKSTSSRDDENILLNIFNVVLNLHQHHPEVVESMRKYGTCYRSNDKEKELLLNANFLDVDESRKECKRRERLDYSSLHFRSFNPQKKDLKIHLIGFSNGGMMAHSFTCAHPEMVDSMTAISSTLVHDNCQEAFNKSISPEKAAEETTRLPSIFTINGTNDGKVGHKGKFLFIIPVFNSSEETTAIWKSILFKQIPRIENEEGKVVSYGLLAKKSGDIFTKTTTIKKGPGVSIPIVKQMLLTDLDHMLMSKDGKSSALRYSYIQATDFILHVEVMHKAKDEDEKNAEKKRKEEEKKKSKEDIKVVAVISPTKKRKRLIFK